MLTRKQLTFSKKEFRSIDLRVPKLLLTQTKLVGPVINYLFLSHRAYLWVKTESYAR